MASRTAIDILQVYLREVGQYRIPTKDESRELLLRAKAGDRLAREELIVRNLRLVIAYAKRLMGRGFDLEDLIQVGNMGLIRAVDKYDPERRTVDGRTILLSTYAVWWIKQALYRELDTKGRFIKMPFGWQKHVRRELDGETNRFLVELTRDVISLDTPVIRGHGKNPSSSKLSDTIASDSEDAKLVEGVLRNDRYFELHLKLSRLNKRHGDILWRRARGEHLEQIGMSLGISRERVRQIEANALTKLAQEYGVMQPHATSMANI